MFAPTDASALTTASGDGNAASAALIAVFSAAPPTTNPLRRLSISALPAATPAFRPAASTAAPLLNRSCPTASAVCKPPPSTPESALTNTAGFGNAATAALNAAANCAPPFARRVDDRLCPIEVQVECSLQRKRQVDVDIADGVDQRVDERLRVREGVQRCLERREQCTGWIAECVDQCLEAVDPAAMPAWIVSASWPVNVVNAFARMPSVGLIAASALARPPRTPAGSGSWPVRR